MRSADHRLHVEEATEEKFCFDEGHIMRRGEIEMKNAAGWRTSGAALCVGLSLLAATVAMPAYSQEYPRQKLGEHRPASDKWTGYKGVPIEKFDFTKPPRCGVKGLSREEKIERNVRLAEWYYQIYLDSAHRDTLRYTWSGPVGGTDCFGADSSMIIGIFKYMDKMPPGGVFMRPKPTPEQIEAERKLWKEGRAPAQLELKMWKSKYPDYTMVPGSFRVISVWEDGVSFILDTVGTSKVDGHKLAYWEQNTFLLNEDGYIWHYDEVADTRGVDEGLRHGWGKGMEDFPYGEVLKSMDEKKGKDSK